MSFIQRELISEIRHYQAEIKELEIEDLLRRIVLNKRPIHKDEIKNLEERIERLVWCCIDIM